MNDIAYRPTTEIGKLWTEYVLAKAAQNPKLAGRALLDECRKDPEFAALDDQYNAQARQIAEKASNA